MRRSGAGVAALITVLGGLAGPPLTRGQQADNARGTSNLEPAFAAGPEFNSSRLLGLATPGLSSPPIVSLPRAAVIGSEPPASKPRKSPRPALLMGMYVSYGLLQVLDAELTIHALQTKRASEGNPVLSPFASNPAALAAFKLGVTSGTILGIGRLRKSHRRLAMVTLAVINGGYACVVMRSYREFSSR